MNAHPFRPPRLLLLLLLASPLGVFAQTPQRRDASTGGQSPQARAATQPSERVPATRIPRLAKDSTITIPLNQVGIFDADYLNPRNPPNVLHPLKGGVQPPPASAGNLVALNGPHNRKSLALQAVDVETVKASAAALIVIFDNRTSTHALLVSFTVPQTDAARKLAQDAGAYVSETCKDKKCPARVQISERTTARIPLEAFVDREAFTKWLTDKQTEGAASGTTHEAIPFSVAFVDETAEPSQPRGYFSVVPLEYLGEPGGGTTWSGVASVGGAIEPDTGGDSQTFTTEAPYGGGRDWRFTGSGELRVKQALGARADADLSLGYKDASLGEKDQKGLLSATKYRINIYAMTGVTLSFGKFTFASPTSGVALRAKGEGFRLAFRNLAVSHLVMRESAEGDANHDNRDNRQLLAEASNLTFAKSGIFRSANAVWLYGRERLDRAAADDKPAVFPHSYFTIGGEAFFASAGNVPWQASLAWYRSGASDLSDGRYRPATGHLAFGTASWSFVDRYDWNPATRAGDPKKSRVNAIVTLQAGIGSRTHDDDATTGENHAYVGEQTAFSPDSLLFSRFAKKLRMATLQPSLGNKIYSALGYTDQRVSPLELVARALRIPTSDMANTSTTVQWHHYTLRQGGAGSGDELSTKWTIETPAGIESTVQCSYFWPRGSLKPLFRVKPWAIVASVKVTL